MIHTAPGRRVGFDHHGLVFGTRVGATATATWIPLAAVNPQRRLPTSFVASRTVVRPYLLGATPLASITSWHYWPAGIMPRCASMGWIASGTDRQGRAVTAWEWGPGGVLHEAWVYTGQGISGAAAVAAARRHGFTVNTALSPRLNDPAAPVWYVAVWNNLNSGWGDVLVSWRTGRIVGHSPHVALPAPP